MSFKSFSQIFYQCNECDYQSKFIAPLKLHYDNQHSGEDHNCDECGFIAKSLRQLQRHIYDHHVKPYSHDNVKNVRNLNLYPNIRTLKYITLSNCTISQPILFSISSTSSTSMPTLKSTHPKPPAPSDQLYH